MTPGLVVVTSDQSVGDVGLDQQDDEHEDDDSDVDADLLKTEF